MKRIGYAIIVAVLIFFTILWIYKSNRNKYLKQNLLERNFDNPLLSAKPSCFWWWLNSLVDEESITHNLEELSEKGIGEVVLICSSNWGGNEKQQLPESGPEFLSQEWFKLFRHTLYEASRLKIRVGINFCASGWTVGGPWISPEINSRWFVHSEKRVKGPCRFSEYLPKPASRGGYEPPYYFNVAQQMVWPERKMDYRDNVVLAFKYKGNAAKFSDKMSALLSAKSNRRDAPPYIEIEELMSPLVADLKSDEGALPVSVDEVIDLSELMGTDGYLDWNVPEGEWVIFRLGHVATGAPLVCILPEMKDGALAIDWLNKSAVDTMFHYMGNRIIKAAGKRYLGRTLTFFHTDSFEDGYPNWTATLLDEFEKYRGYNPRPYLPVFAGYIIGNADISNRFLADYRKTVADMFADNSLGYMEKKFEEYGLEFESEAGGPSWSGTVCIDALKNLGRTDRPMGEFWKGAFVDANEQNYVCKQTASAAHIYGKTYANAESFTDVSHWTEYPFQMKAIADRAFCEGINRITFHTVTLQRLKDGKPGYEYGAGTHFNPNVTWWEIGAAPWIEYLTRCSSMLQTGTFVADILFYNGDWCPNIVKGDYSDYIGVEGYDCDICNEEVLLDRIDVDNNGNIVLPGGLSYRVLVLPDVDFMPLEVAKKIKTLVSNGATIIGPKPIRDSGLKDYPNADREILKISKEVWDDVDGNTSFNHEYGRGRVFYGKPIKEVLLSIGVGPDIKVEQSITEESHVREVYKDLFQTTDTVFVDYIHRSTNSQDFYFVINKTADRQIADISFRVGACRPQLWDPVSGEKRFLSRWAYYGGRCYLPLRFEPFESFFIIFDHSNKEILVNDKGNNYFDYDTINMVNSEWTLEFDNEWFYDTGSIKKKSTKITLNMPMNLALHRTDAVKYYSGTINYYTEFNCESSCFQYDELLLDLGDVFYIAEVYLNGKKLGTDWFPPYRFDITTCLKEGRNKLEIKVANLWCNRLVGDLFLPEDERKTFTNIQFRPDKNAVLPSGLAGPVSILGRTR